jgi:hypothetical protein
MKDELRPELDIIDMGKRKFKWTVRPVLDKFPASMGPLDVYGEWLFILANKGFFCYPAKILMDKSVKDTRPRR